LDHQLNNGDCFARSKNVFQDNFSILFIDINEASGKIAQLKLSKKIKRKKEHPT
jgi:hypothetical protein